jgi:anti-sigma B factor antagonist
MNQTPIVTAREVGDVSVLSIEGDVTAFAEGPIDRAYEGVVTDRTKILLSFRDGDHINSAGIAILIDLISRARQRERTIRISHPDAHFHKIFKMVGLTSYASVHANEEDGLKGF